MRRRAKMVQRHIVDVAEGKLMAARRSHANFLAHVLRGEESPAKKGLVVCQLPVQPLIPSNFIRFKLTVKIVLPSYEPIDKRSIRGAIESFLGNEERSLTATTI